jgi:hypothetical protein
MNINTKPLTVAFLAVFALWFTSSRYNPPSFYSWLLTPMVGNVLALWTCALFLLIVALVARRGIKVALFPWVEAAVIGCAIVGFDLFWRFYLSQFAWDAFKLTSIALDMATPAIAILGMFVVSSELKRSYQVIAGDNLSNG